MLTAAYCRLLLPPREDQVFVRATCRHHSRERSLPGRWRRLGDACSRSDVYGLPIIELLEINCAKVELKEVARAQGHTP